MDPENKPTNYPSGIELIERGKCPIEAIQPIACMFCNFGHMTECHYPLNCEEAICSHYYQGQM